MSKHRFDRPIQLRRPDDELSEYGSSQDHADSSEDEKNSSENDSESNMSTDGESQYGSDFLDEEGDDHENLKDISFGALAKAQEAFGPPSSRTKKRKLSDMKEDDNVINLPTHKTQVIQKEQKHPSSKPNQPIHRSSKHAPTVLSSKHPVSRKRQVFEAPPTAKFRDPRFDAATQSATLNPRAIEHADKNYSFLSTYQATEIQDLKSQLKKSRDPTHTATLKRQIMSLEQKLRNTQTREQQRTIQRQHQAQERQDIKTGKKARPFYLKQSEIRKKINQERTDAMGKRAKDKMEKRKLKKLKGKESRDMPRVRRSVLD